MSPRRQNPVTRGTQRANSRAPKDELCKELRRTRRLVVELAAAVRYLLEYASPGPYCTAEQWDAFNRRTDSIKAFVNKL